MSIMLFNKSLKKPQLCPHYICIILLFYFCFNGYSQNYPYPQLPKNTEEIESLSPTFTWVGGDNFVKYQFKLYNCSYEKGDNFKKLNLGDYKFVSAVKGEQGYESSNLTINESRVGCFTTVDDGGTKIKSFQNNFSSPSEYSISNFEGNDFEGLTYLYNDYFLMVDEYNDRLLFLNLNYDNSNNLTKVERIKTYHLNSNLLTGINDGWEGITYNPIENKLYLIKETNSPSIYEATCTKAPYFTGDIKLKEPFKFNNTTWRPDRISGLYHLSLNQALSATPAGQHLLILSKATNTVYEFDLTGKLISELNIDTKELEPYNNGFFKPEGLTYSNGKLYLASDSELWTTAMYYIFENKKHQNPIAEDKVPVFLSEDIYKTKFNLPKGILKNDEKYCWQVVAYTSNGKAYESAAYSFKVELPCFNYLTHLPNSTTNTQPYYAQNFIKSYKTVKRQDTLTYFSSTYVELTKGFEVKKGGIFFAGIGECD